MLTLDLLKKYINGDRAQQAIRLLFDVSVEVGKQEQAIIGNFLIMCTVLQIFKRPGPIRNMMEGEFLEGLVRKTNGAHIIKVWIIFR